MIIVKNSSGSNLNDIYDVIEAGRISSNVKEFWFKYYTIFSQDLQSYRQNQIENFNRILKLFEINDRSTVKFQNFSITNRNFVDASTEFIVNAKKFVFAFNRNLYRAHWDNPKTKFKGIAYIPGSKEDIIVVKWESFKASNLSIALEEDSTQFKSEWYDNFPSEDSSDKLILYVAINEIYVTEIIYSQLDLINEVWT